MGLAALDPPYGLTALRAYVAWSPDERQRNLVGPVQLRPSRCARVATMKTKMLTEVLERVEDWPAHVQDQLAEIALDIEAALKKGDYDPTPEELAGIDRGLRAAAEGRFATDEEVEAAFAKFRRS
jgi:predicted transcriptional regulator